MSESSLGESREGRAVYVIVGVVVGDAVVVDAGNEGQLMERGWVK